MLGPLPRGATIVPRAKGAADQRVSRSSQRLTQSPAVLTFLLAEFRRQRPQHIIINDRQHPSPGATVALPRAYKPHRQQSSRLIQQFLILQLGHSAGLAPRQEQRLAAQRRRAHSALLDPLPGHHQEAGLARLQPRARQDDRRDERGRQDRPAAADDGDTNLDKARERRIERRQSGQAR